MIKFTASEEISLFHLLLNHCKAITDDCKIQLMGVICSPLVLWVSDPPPGTRPRAGKGELQVPGEENGTSVELCWNESHLWGNAAMLVYALQYRRKDNVIKKKKFS